MALSQREINRVRRESQKDPEATAREIQKAVGDEAGNLSLLTIRRYLLRCGHFFYRPTICPSLSRKQRLVGQKWAQARLAWTKSEWSRVTFSDETYIELHIIRKLFSSVKG